MILEVLGPVGRPARPGDRRYDVPRAVFGDNVRQRRGAGRASYRQAAGAQHVPREVMSHPIRIVISPATVYGEGLSEADLGAGVVGNVARQFHGCDCVPAQVVHWGPGRSRWVPDRAIVGEGIGEGQAATGLVDDRYLKVNVEVTIVYRIERPAAEAAEGRGRPVAGWPNKAAGRNAKVKARNARNIM